MGAIREQFANQYEYHAVECAKINRIQEVVEELGLMDKNFYLSMGTCQYVDGKYLGPYLSITPQHLAGVSLWDKAGNIGLYLTDTTPTLADCAKLLLPKVGKWEKSFDETTNEIVLKTEYKGVRIQLRDRTPETCTVEKVEETVEVPEETIAAHTETRVRYVLKGDCDPLLEKATAT